jgi:serine protease AprX
LCVGAVDNTGAYAAFSSQGYSADHRVKPDVMSQGQNSTVISSSSGNVITSSGTSFATPVLAGMVACLWQGNPTKTNMQVIQAIKQSATQYATPDSLMGHGIPDFCLADQILKGSSGIYSNPSLQYDASGFYVSGMENCKLTVELFDVQGNLLASEQTQITNYGGKNYLAVPSYNTAATGMYIIRITSDKGDKWVRKVVKS